MTVLIEAMIVPTILAVGGAVAISALLWLATFSRDNVLMIGGVWLLLGMFCTLFAFAGPTIFFLLLMVAGLALIFLPSLMAPSNKGLRPWVLYVAWVYFWVTAFVGWRNGWLGLLLITLPALLIAELGFFFVAGFLLPFPNPDLYRGGRPAPKAGGIPTFSQEIKDLFYLIRYSQNRDVLKQCIQQRRKTLQCLLTFALGTNRPYYVVIDEKIAERTEETRTWLTEEEKLIKRLDGNLYGEFMTGPGIIITGCDHAVAIATSLKFKGAKGPGVIFTGYGDEPKYIIDLRVQLRAFPVEAWTKDGIAVKFFTFIPFQIGAGKEQPALGTGFPYRSSAVFKAVHAQLVEHQDPSQVQENLKQHAWYDLPEIAGEHIVREIISKYEFDELYAPFELYDDSGQHPRDQIVGELKERLDHRFLFSVELNLQSDLEKTKPRDNLPDNLRREFESHGVLLSDSATIMPEERGSRWSISDTKRNYIVSRVYEALNIYERNQGLPKWGIQRIGCGIGNIEPVDEHVLEQRIEAWKADWTRKIMLKRAAGQSERLRLVEQARAQAQVDIILAVGKQIEQLRTTGADAVARYFIEVLTELSGKAALRQLLPGDTNTVLQRAFGRIEEEATGAKGEQTNAREA